MKYNCVIFDLDGTLLDTLGDLCNSVNFALNSMSLPKRSLQEVRSFLGNGTKVLMQKSMNGKGDLAEAYQTFQKHYIDNCMVLTKPYSGVIDLLTKLISDNVKCAVVSNKNDSITKKLISNHFDGLFSVVIGQQNGIMTKPNPQMVEMAITQLGCKKGETLFVGDSEVDSLTAVNANIDCALVSYGYRDKTALLQEKSIAVIDNPNDLLALME